MLHSVDLPKDKHGALRVNNRLQVEGHPNICALGDCASVPIPDGRGFYSSTAQNAIREGPVAAHNIAAVMYKTGNLKAFTYKPIGSLASLGQRQAVAQLGPLQLSGLPAWFAWRGIYLAKLPTISNRVLVAFSWITDIFAPVDIVQMPQGRQQRVLPGKMPAQPGAAPPSQPMAPDGQPATGQRVPS